MRFSLPSSLYMSFRAVKQLYVMHVLPSVSHQDYWLLGLVRLSG